MMNEFELGVLNLVKFFVYFKIFTFIMKVLFFRRKSKKDKGETIISKIFITISNPIKYLLDDLIHYQEICRQEKLSQREGSKVTDNVINFNNKKKEKA